MKNLRNLEIYSVQNNIILRFLLIMSKKCNFVGLILEIMGNGLIVILIAVAAVGFFILVRGYYSLRQYDCHLYSSIGL